jgi:hypothetical protein
VTLGWIVYDWVDSTLEDILAGVETKLFSLRGPTLYASGLVCGSFKNRERWISRNLACG